MKEQKIITRFITSIKDACNPKLQQKEKCVFTSRDYVATVMRMLESQGNFIIRTYTYAGGETKYHLIEIN